jgi:hypothetical protein
MHGLAAFAGNVTSQSGEDGILAEIFRRIGTAHRSCVEFGAWNGKHLSNTWSMWHEQGWRAVLIEGEPERHAALASSLADFPRVRAICAYVRPEGENSLDSLLARCGLERDFDLLSIDVDGDDYHIWRGLNRFQARVVVVEYNPTIPPELELVQRKGGYFGASARSLVSLASTKGYRLACCTKTNCIFVDAACWDALGLGAFTLEDVFPRGHLTYVINSYDGKTYLNRIPTYSHQLPPLTPGVLVRELRTSLSPDLSGAERPAEPGSALSPVRIFGLPENPPRGGLAWRALRFVWRAFVATPAGAPAGKLLAQWRRRRNAGAAIEAWEQQGRPVPPPHAYKERVVREYARRHALLVLVETGTYLGDMVEAVGTGFRQIYSIELDRELHRRAAPRFAARGNVAIMQGDNGKVLPQVLAGIEGPALFWLDGHYAADITARGDKDTPIVRKLESISRHPVKRHVILIDDARCFDGTHDYPTLKELEDAARQYWPASAFEVRDDIIRIAPAR